MLCLRSRHRLELELNEITAWRTGLPGSVKEETPENTERLIQVSWNQVNMLQTLGDTFDGFVGEFLRQP